MANDDEGPDDDLPDGEDGLDDANDEDDHCEIEGQIAQLRADIAAIPMEDPAARRRYAVGCVVDLLKYWQGRAAKRKEILASLATRAAGIDFREDSHEHFRQHVLADMLFVLMAERIADILDEFIVELSAKTSDR